MPGAYQHFIGVASVVLALVVSSACAAPPAALAPKGGTAPGSAPATASASAAPGPAGSAPPAAPERLRVSWSSPTGGYWPLQAARAQGFFERQGVSVDLVLAGGAQAVTALVAHEIDAAIPDGAALVRAGLAGSDVVLIASTLNVIPFQVVAGPEVGRPEDLRGKRLGITRAGTTLDFAARSMLRSVGLLPDADVALIQMNTSPDLFPALLAGAVDAAVLGMPDAYFATKQGYTSVYQMASMGLEYPTVPTGVLRSTIAEQPAALRAFVAGLTEAVAWIKHNRAEALQVLAEYTKMDDTEALAATYAVQVPLFPQAPYPTAASIATVLESIRADEPRAADAQPADFLDDRFVRELDQSGFIRRLYP